MVAGLFLLWQIKRKRFEQIDLAEMDPTLRKLRFRQYCAPVHDREEGKFADSYSDHCSMV